MAMSRRFRVVITPNPSGGYTAFVPTLPGCTTDAPTLSEIRERIEHAIQSHIARLEAQNRPVPKEHPATIVMTIDVD